MSPAALDALLRALRERAEVSKKAAASAYYAENRERYHGEADATMVAIEMIEAARTAEVAS